MRLLRIALLTIASLPAADWQSLFDGRTTAGWLEITGKPFPATWKVEDGCLRTLPPTAGAQDIRTTDAYAAFEFAFEFKMAAGSNSGVKYLIAKVDEWNNKAGRQARARGLEYQIADAANADIAPLPNRLTGALYAVFAPQPPDAPAPGVFHTGRIVVRGTAVEHWLDGRRVVQFDTHDPAVVQRNGGPVPAASPISLQHHQTPVWFRNLRVRRLD
jgi:hypothetical protein